MRDNSISSDTTMTNCSFTGICLNFTSINNNTPAIAEVLKADSASPVARKIRGWACFLFDHVDH